MYFMIRHKSYHSWLDATIDAKSISITNMGRIPVILSSQDEASS